MPLPSQMARSSASGGNRNYRQRRRRRSPLPFTGAGLGVMALGAVVVGAVVWFGWSVLFGSDDPAADPGQNTELATGADADRDPDDGLGGADLYERPRDRGLTQPLDRSVRSATTNTPSNTATNTAATPPVIIDQSGAATGAGAGEREASRSPSDARDTAGTPSTERQGDRPSTRLGDALERLGNQSPPAEDDAPPTTGREAQAGPGPEQGDSDDGTGAIGSAETLRVVRAAQRATEENDPLLARELLNRLLTSGGLTQADARVVRDRLTELNRDLVFSPRIVEGDPFTSSYRIQSGDALSRIASREGLEVHWRLLQRVNRIDDPRKIQLGQTIKLVHGPFHAVVHKHDYRLDLYAGPPDQPEAWVYVMSMPCGLGEDNSTPTGEFVVRENSKLENPHWINPRTGERYDADNPENPIGERWIGIKGLGEYEALTGYGIHGTIEPESIGRDASMGCVRLGDEDVNVVYELLVERTSRVTILP